MATRKEKSEELIKAVDELWVDSTESYKKVKEIITNRIGGGLDQKAMRAVIEGAMLMINVISVGYQEKESLERVYGVCGKMLGDLLKIEAEIK